MRRSVLSVSQCRKILGPSCALDDSEVEVVRDQLYSLAEVVIDYFDLHHRESIRKALEGPQDHQSNDPGAN